MKYKAFISYKHLTSTKFAEHLELAIKAYAKPIWQPPIKIFRDEKYLKPGINLPDLIRTALDDSLYLIYLASPDAARSNWVQEELEFWCSDEERLQRLIVVLTDGIITEDPNTMMMDWEKTNALPQSLASKIDFVPFYVDLSWAKTLESQSLLNPEYKKAINLIVATLRDIDPIELTGVEVLRHRRNIRIKNIFITAITLLAVGLAFTAVFAWNEKRKAEWRAIYSESLRLAETSPNLAAHTLRELSDNATVAAVPLAWQLINDTPIWTSAEFRGHGGDLWSLEFDPNGRLATGGADGTVRLWSPDNTKPPLVLAGHKGHILDIDLSRDGEKILTASEYDATRIWDAQSGKLLREIPDEEGQVNHVGFRPKGPGFMTASYQKLQFYPLTGSPITLAEIDGLSDAEWHPNGKLMATTSYKKGIAAQLHSVDSTQVPLTLKDTSEAGAREVAFSPDGSIVAVICSDGTLRLYNGTNGSPIRSIVQNSPVDQQESVRTTAERLLAFSKDGKTVAAAFGRKLYLWSVSGAESPQVLTHVNPIEDFDLDEKGQQLITLDSQGSAYFWSPDPSGTYYATALRGQPDITRVAFTPDSRQLVTTAGDGTIRYWVFKKPMQPVTVLEGHQGPVKFGSFSPDGTKIVTASDDGTAKLWNASDGKEIATLRPTPSGKVSSAAFSPDGEHIVLAGQSGSFLYAVNGKGEPMRIHKTAVTQAAYNSDGSQLIVLTKARRNQDVDSVYLYPQDGGLRKVFQGKASISNFSPLSPDNKKLVTFSWKAQQAYIHDVEGQYPTDTLKGHESFVLDAGFSPDSELIITASSDMTVRLWEVQTGQEKALFAGAGAEVEYARFLPAGTRILTTSAEHKVRLWDTEGLIIRKIQARGALEQLGFSKDGKSFLIVESGRGEKYHAVRVLDENALNDPILLTGHKNRISHSDFSPDGRSVLTTSDDGTAKIYSIHWPNLRKTLMVRSPQIYGDID